MKQTIRILLITLFSFLTLHFHPHDLHTDTIDTKITKKYYVDFFKKYVLYVITFPILLHCHKDIINFITYRPYTSSFTFYFLVNYYCDSLLNLEKQKYIILLMYELKNIGLYFVLIYGIKNYIYQPYKNLNIHISEKNFLQNISEILPYSLDDTTLHALKFYYELKNYLYSLNRSLIIESEEFIFLYNPTTINLQTALYITQNNPNLHQKLIIFEKNPKNNVQALIDFFKLEITQSLINLEKKLLQSNIKSSIIL